MSTAPVTTAIPDAPSSDDAQSSREVHLADAQKFFAPKDAAPAAPAPKAAPAPVATTPPANPADKIASVVKLPGAKPVEAPPAADVVVEDVAKDLAAPDEKSKSFTGWKELKTRAQTYAEKAAKLERELAVATKTAAEAKSTAPVDDATRSRLAELEEQNKSFSERLKVLDLRNHPEFVSKYLTPQEQAKNKLLAIAKSDEVDVNVDSLLALSGKKFNSAVSETLESLTPYARVQFQAALDTLLSARVGADEALAKADESLKAMSSHSGARSRAEFDKVAKDYTGLYAPVTPDEKADDAAKQAAAAYNADLAAVTKAAEQYAFGALDERKAAELAHKAAMFDFTLSRGIPRIGELYNAELAANAEKIAALEKQVADLTKASPRISGGAGGSSTDAPRGEESHLEAARRINFR